MADVWKYEYDNESKIIYLCDMLHVVEDESELGTTQCSFAKMIFRD